MSGLAQEGVALEPITLALWLLIDADGMVMEAEGAVASALGLGRRELLGRAVLHCERLRPILGSGIERALGGQASSGHLDTPSGPLELAFSPRPGNDGPQMGCLVIGIDASRCRQTEVELRARERDLEHSISLLSATIEASNDGLLVVDREGKIRAFNERFARMWHIPAELTAQREDEVLLRFVLDQLEEPAEFLRGVQRLYSRPEDTSFDVLRFRDGRIFERFSSPQRLDAEVVGRVWSFRDVTERERFAAENARLYHEAQDALRARDEFLSIAAHEIRGPLTSMQLGVQSLLGKGVPESVVPQILERLERELRRLARFADDLLDLGRIRAGRLQFDFEEIELVSLAREVMSRLAPELERSGSTVELAASEPIRGVWDRLRIDQVISNLLSNAIKFGQGKPIGIAIEGRNGWAALAVRDQGIGVPPELRERIFAPFQRAVSSRRFGGLGIGLYIVRTIVERLGGHIHVESELGVGSTFTVDLPRGRRG